MYIQSLNRFTSNNLRSSKHSHLQIECTFSKSTDSLKIYGCLISQSEGYISIFVDLDIQPTRGLHLALRQEVTAVKLLVIVVISNSPLLIDYGSLLLINNTIANYITNLV